MKRSGLLALSLLLVGCATTYHLPAEERSRSYRAQTDRVWAAALASGSQKNGLDTAFLLS